MDDGIVKSLLDRLRSNRVAILIATIILASVGVYYYVQITVRDVEESLPLRVMQEKRDMETVARNFYTFLTVTDAALVHPTKGNLESVRENLNVVIDSLHRLRDRYRFNTLIGASALHAALSPTVDDVQIWLDKGFGNLPPSSPTVLQLIATRSRDTLNKVYDKTTEADRLAYEILEHQTSKLQRLRNSLFVPILVLIVLAILIIWLTRREQQAAKRQAEAEAAKLKAQSQLHDALENITEGFSLYDNNDRLIISNSNYRKLLHADDPTIMQPGTAFKQIIKQAVDRGFIADAAKNRGEWLSKRLSRHKNPGEPHIQRYSSGKWIRVSERKTNDGGTVAVYTDITQLKKREEELAEIVEKLEIARDEAESATRTKSQFLANMSHELRTPLNAVIGITEMLLDDAKDLAQDEMIEPLERISRAGKHLLSLINEILDLSKIEAGRIELQEELFDMWEIVEDAVTTAKTLAEKNSNQIVMDCPRDIGEMRADQTRFRQIIFNLLSNACKFTEDGTITLTATRTADDWLNLKIVDTGIGMNEIQIGKLFQEFTQADESTTRKYGGTGLGLAISQRLSKLMGGDISVQSALGEGSTFTLQLPCRITRKYQESEGDVDQSFDESHIQ